MPEQDQNTIVAPIVSKSQSISSTLNRNIEIFSLTPSTLLTLWEIDASVIMDETGIRNINDKAIFRFHNSVKLMNTTIKWNGQDYIAVPIQAQGFEYTAKGSPPTPKLTLAVNDEGAPMLSLLKSRIRELNDLTGVRVTRRRVFAKYIDGENFETISQEDLAGKGFSPDPNMKFEPDIYFIDRKSIENKSVIEFELGSILDIEGIKIPGRIVVARRCPFVYRGAGCMYEYKTNRVNFIHGDAYDATNNASGSTLLDDAPPVANEKDELIQEILNSGTVTLNTTTAVNGSGGGNREFETFSGESSTGFTGTDTADQGYGYFPVTIVAGRRYQISSTIVMTNGTIYRFITSNGTNFFTDTIDVIVSTDLGDTPSSGVVYEFTAAANATHVGLAAIRTSGTMQMVVSNFSFVELGYIVNVSITKPTVYKKDTNYVKGNAVWIQKDGVKYYFVAKSNSPPIGPPNPLFWISDSCAKNINSCRLRFKNAAALNFGGFPSVQTAV